MCLIVEYNHYDVYIVLIAKRTELEHEEMNGWQEIDRAADEVTVKATTNILFEG